MPKKKATEPICPDKPVRRRAKSLREVNAEGDMEQTLRALADRLSAEIDACQSAAVLPSLSKQLRETLDAIAAIRPEEDSDVEEIISGIEKVR